MFDRTKSPLEKSLALLENHFDVTKSSGDLRDTTKFRKSLGVQRYLNGNLSNEMDLYFSCLALFSAQVVSCHCTAIGFQNKVRFGAPGTSSISSAEDNRPD